MGWPDGTSRWVDLVLVGAGDEGWLLTWPSTAIEAWSLSWAVFARSVDVVDEDIGCGAGGYIEVMVPIAGDSEVPHPAVMVGRGGAPVSGDDGTIGCLKFFTYFEVICRNPLVQVRCVDWTNGTLVMNLRTP